VPSSALESNKLPDVSHSGMNEWPAPATRTDEARVTIACSSASLRGRSSSRGSTRTLPDQLLHVIAISGA
jgi:hypothetical protein